MIWNVNCTSFKNNYKRHDVHDLEKSANLICSPKHLEAHPMLCSGIKVACVSSHSSKLDFSH